MSIGKRWLISTQCILRSLNTVAKWVSGFQSSSLAPTLNVIYIYRAECSVLLFSIHKLQRRNFTLERSWEKSNLERFLANTWKSQSMKAFIFTHLKYTCLDFLQKIRLNASGRITLSYWSRIHKGLCIVSKTANCHCEKENWNWNRYSHLRKHVIIIANFKVYIKRHWLLSNIYAEYSCVNW